MPSTNRFALSATIHCLTGCGIGEVLGLVIATQLGCHDLPSILLAIVLAFVFGYSLTLRPLLASGVALGRAARLAFAADTLSITVMEIVDKRSGRRDPGSDGRSGHRPAVLGQPRAVSGDRRCRGIPGEPIADPARAGPRRAARPPLAGRGVAALA